MVSTGSDVLFSGKQYNLSSETSPGQTIQLDETEKFEQSYPFNSNGKVSVSNVNGSITVEAWDKNEIRLEATKIADSKETLAEVEIKVDSQPNNFSVEADYDSWNSRNRNSWKNYKKLEVQFRLKVPRNAVLDEIESVNGSVTISNFTNIVKASAVNGQVRALSLRGTANLSTVNGTVSVDYDKLDSGNKVTLETVNGRVDLLIPSDSNATVKADTVNGRIENDFGLPVRKGEYVGKDLYGRIGSGEAQIRLNSVNGHLFVKRKDDGKPLSQPFNLLNDVNTKVEEADRESSTGNFPRLPKINSAKVNKEIAAAIKNSEKERLASLKEAQIEIDEAMKALREELKGLDPAIALAAEDSVRISLENLKNLKEIDIEQVKLQIEKLKLDHIKQLDRFPEVNWTGNLPLIEKKSETFQVKGTPKVTVNAAGCDIKVRGWDKSEVQYVVKKLSRSRSPKPIQLTADAGDSEIKLTVNNDEENNLYGENVKAVHLEVFVPKKSNLKITTDGEVRLENVTGEIDLKGEESAINIRDVEGKLRLFTADGRVRVIGFRGEIEAETNDSDVYLEGDFTKINAGTTGGDIYLTLAENASALIKMDGEIGFVGENKSKTFFGSDQNITINRQSNSERDVTLNIEAGGAVNGQGGKLCAGCPGFVKEGENLWRIGNGDSKYNFTSENGILYIRNSREIKVK